MSDSLKPAPPKPAFSDALEPTVQSQGCIDPTETRKSDASRLVGFKHPFWTLYGYLKSTFFWISFTSSRKNPVVFDFDSMLLILKEAPEAAQNVSYIESIGSVILNIMNVKDEVDICKEKWRNLFIDMESIHSLLVGFHRDIERSRGYSQTPDQARQAIQILCSNLIHTTVTLQECLQLHEKFRIITIFRQFHQIKEVEICKCELEASLNLLRVSILPKIICEVPSDILARENIPLDITSSATPRRFRFMDCAQFAKAGILCISEFPAFPHVPYVALSYVWRGNDVDPTSISRKFSVKGAEEADPISIDVLNHACAASLKRGIGYLFLDRLSIMQTSRDDKNWQISHMYRVYQLCNLCIVLPGGMQRLVRIDEETLWIHRGWTLQEVLAPPLVFVLFAWKLGPGKGRGGDDTEGSIDEVILRQSAMAPISLILDACTTGFLSFTGAIQSNIEATVFSPQPVNYSWNDVPFWRPQRKVLPPNVAALAVAMNRNLSTDSDPDARDHAIWQSSLMRTSSRPVDMVFSVMGLFGVILDTSAFHKNDRLGATIALAKEILSRGGSASWLGASFRLEPCRQLSTFSIFPRTKVAGKALVHTKDGYREASELMDSEYPYAEALLPMPKGSMDDAGYFTFTRKAIQVVSIAHGRTHEQQSTQPGGDPSKQILRALDGSAWEILESEYAKPSESFHPCAYAVLLGFFSGYYPGATSAHDANNVRAMLVEEHAPDRFHLRSFFFLSVKSRGWVMTWKEREFTVGDPDTDRPDPGTLLEAEDLHEITVREARRPLHTASASTRAVTLKDKAARSARWAVGQRVLERHYPATSDAEDK